jgi:hypothetical protein
VNAEIQEIFKKNESASLLVGALKGHNARKEVRQLKEEERKAKGAKGGFREKGADV